MVKKDWDFAGWATRNDIKCSDGVTIRKDAFKHNDGATVPLMWQHSHNDPDNVIGKVKLVNKPQGVYAYGYFNKNERAQSAKEAIVHGDINAMSIGASKIKKRALDVVHGVIYEVSLVLAGANPGAQIEEVLNHSDEVVDDKLIVYSGNLIHSSEDIIDEGVEEMDLTVEEINAVLETLDEDQEAAVTAFLEHQLSGQLQHADELGEDATIEEVLETLNEQQSDAVVALVAAIQEDDNEDNNEGEDNEIQQSQTGGKKMKKNLFATVGAGEETQLLHSAKESVNAVISEGFKTESGTLKKNLAAASGNLQHGITSELQAVLTPDLEHGITNIEVLFPEATAVTPTPVIYKDQQTNAEKIVAKIHKSPFSRVKTWYADFTAKEARARGYIKGNEKVEQIFELAHRETTPQTIYKKQGIDRDDVIDVQIDIIPFVNSEMNMMLKEEIVRAVLVGDGREVSDKDKIKPANIRPIISDDDLYTIKKASANIASVLEDVILALGDYQGSGIPSLYINPKTASKIRLLKTGTGAYLFGQIPSLDAVATMLGVDEIITTSFLSEKDYVIVNLADYTLGASKGGEITNFDDFDIDFNKYKFLIETRLSGALTVLKSAIYGTITDTSTPGPVTMKVATETPAAVGE